MVTPLAFLDIDGPLNVYGRGAARDALEKRDIDLLASHGFAVTVHLDPQHAALIKKLDDAGFELAWATMWEDDANEHFLAWLELAEPLPVVPFSAEQYVRLELPSPLSRKGLKFSQADPWCPKAPSVLRFAGDRPFAWFDDDFVRTDADWAQARTEAGSPTLLVHVSEDTGLTEAHIDQALEWLSALETKPEASA